MQIERIFSVSCEQSNLLNLAESALADRSITRADMAEMYADAICADEVARRDGRQERVDFAAVNAAILRRWTVSGLTWIKELAWKRARETHASGLRPPPAARTTRKPTGETAE
jgi:hypothetical protein